MTPTNNDELDKLFPTWFKKQEVTFSAAVPLSTTDRQQVFSMSYTYFEAIIQKYVTQKCLEARTKENERWYKHFTRAMFWDSSDYRFVSKDIKTRIKQLKSKGGK